MLNIIYVFFFDKNFVIVKEKKKEKLLKSVQKNVNKNLSIFIEFFSIITLKVQCLEFVLFIHSFQNFIITLHHI